MKRKAKAFIGVISILGLSVTSGPALAATVLSKAQQEALAARIAELGTVEDRTAASAWSDAKKVAEFICRPLASSELEEWNREADRVFLGTDDPKTLELRSDHLLTGSGQVRTGNDWTEFTFECVLDPQTGKAVSFKTNL